MRGFRSPLTGTFHAPPVVYIPGRLHETPNTRVNPRDWPFSRYLTPHPTVIRSYGLRRALPGGTSGKRRYLSVPQRTTARNKIIQHASSYMT